MYNLFWTRQEKIFYFFPAFKTDPENCFVEKADANLQPFFLNFKTFQRTSFVLSKQPKLFLKAVAKIKSISFTNQNKIQKFSENLSALKSCYNEVQLLLPSCITPFQSGCKYTTEIYFHKDFRKKFSLFFDILEPQKIRCWKWNF